MNFFSSRKKALLVFSFLMTRLASFSQNEPVSQAANSMVDLLTGDFNYSLPVMTVPGPNGENVPISFSYHGGIRMDEEASWIGLGWNYNPGEITRNLHGTPDDWNGKSVVNATWKQEINSIQKTTGYYGPLYFANCLGNDTAKRMDIYSSSYRFVDPRYVFSFPDYDDFNVSGPGLSKTMSARVFSWGAYYLGSVLPYSHNSGPLFPSAKKVHFYFDDDINQYGLSQHLGAYDNFFIYTSPHVYVDFYSASTNRVFTGNCIDYYTNGEINSNYADIKNKGFLDYRIVSGNTKRASSEFDPDGIGAYRITTPNGMVYHYSLPVYTQAHEMNFSFSMDNAYNLDNSKDLTTTDKTEKYAVSWKLTAVTGPDYIDANGNGIADIGDTGYWIAYNYGKWIDDFNWKYPFYNYKPNVYNQRAASNFSLAEYIYQSVKNNVGTVSKGATQRYYLNSIQTATHTAYFIKETRLDNHAVKETDNAIAPSLRLSKIILVRNENVSLFSTGGGNVLPCDSRFLLSQTNCSVAEIMPHIGNYNANKVLIDANSLTTVELTADYSLCKWVYNNINNTFPTTTVSYAANGSPIDLFKKFDHVSGTPSSTDAGNSGKLTLTSVKLFTVGHMATEPAYLFDYNQTDATKNPDYSTFRTDYWGYNKSDYDYNVRGRYTTEGTTGSCKNVDAWSLKKITTPLGGEINIEYESDKYEKANYGGVRGNYESPEVIFLIQNVDFPTTATIQKIGVFKEINNFIGLPGILKRKVYVPFVIDPAPPTCLPYLGYAIKDSCATGCSGLSLTTTIGSTVNTQKFNFSFAVGSSACDVVSTRTLYYNPLTYINPTYQGWGYVKLTMPYMYGGGTRVKQISFRDPDSNQSHTNEYTYENGSAGSEPVDIYDYGAGTIGSNRNAADALAPPSVVTYGKVTVRSKSLDNVTYNGKTEYQFDNMYEPIYTSSAVASLPLTFSVVQTVGACNRLLSIKDIDNNNNIIRYETYDYGTVNQNGVNGGPSIEESFTLRLLKQETNGVSYINMNFIKIQLKDRLKKITTYKDGVTTTQEFLDFDLVTGQVTRERITNPSFGIKETRTRLAYLDYPGMGARTKDVANKNILYAASKTEVYKDRLMRNIYGNVVGTGLPELISGSKTTWRQLIPVRNYSSSYITQNQTLSNWQPFKTSVFNGNTDDNTWREEAEVTLFNKRQQPLEIKNGASNRYASSKMGYDQQFQLCSAGDAKYADFTFSGFEDQETVASGVVNFGGEVTLGTMRDPGTSIIKPHTGNYLAKVPANTTGPGYFTKGFTTGRTYRASVWVYKDSPSNASLVVTLDGSNGAGSPVYVYKSISLSDASNITAGNWKLMTLTIDIPANYAGSGGTYGLNDMRAYLVNSGSTPAYFDDFMFRPVDAALSGNVIDEKTGRTMAVLDNQNFATKYEYDYEGRVKTISVETPVIGFQVKTFNKYNYKRPYY
jgi:hypothetical protein